MTQLRHFDEGWPLWAWSAKIDVVCPRCGAAGVVHRVSPRRFSDASFHCQQCAYTLTSAEPKWHGALIGHGRTSCGHCGYKWVTADRSFASSDDVQSANTIADCPKCSRPNEVTLSISGVLPNDYSAEPTFGLDLLLKQETRLGTIWVYNAQHLADLKAYVAAKQRVSVHNHHAYFKRLPRWIQSAKNRELVLKAISKLEQKLKTS